MKPDSNSIYVHGEATAGKASFPNESSIIWVVLYA